MFYDGIEWVWFDLDDTLYDFSRASLEALGEVYSIHRLGRFFNNLTEWVETYHRHNSALWELYNHAGITKERLKLKRFSGPLSEAGADNNAISPLAAALDRDYLRLLGRKGYLIEGAAELLGNLKSHGKKIGLLSNGFKEVQYDKLKSSRLDHKVDCVVLSDEIGVNKPDKRLFDYALGKSGASASHSVMIGDNPATDILGAVNAGWRAVLFSPGSAIAPSDLPEGVDVITRLGQAEVCNIATSSKMVED